MRAQADDKLLKLLDATPRKAGAFDMEGVSKKKTWKARTASRSSRQHATFFLRARVHLTSLPYRISYRAATLARAHGEPAARSSIPFAASRSVANDLA